MANNVNIPAQGTGDTTPRVSTDQVSADSSQVQNFQLASVSGGVLTRNPTIPVSNASLPLPAGAATSANQATDQTLTGGVTEAAPGTDTASSGLNGRLQRIAQRLTSILGVLPAALGQTTKAGSLSVTLASNQDALPITDNAGSITVDGTVSTTPPANASTNVAQVAGTATDVNSGVKSAGTQRIVLATDQPQLTNALKVDGSAVTQPVSLSGNQATNVAQINGVTPLMGAGNTGTGSPRVTIATDQAVLPVNNANPVQAATATLANVTGSASSVTLQASNGARKGLVIVNDSTANLFVKFGSTASSTSYSYFLAGSVSGVPATLELPAVVYTGIVTGIWASAVGAARVTELT